MSYVVKTPKGLYLYAIEPNNFLFCKKKELAIKFNCSLEQALSTLKAIQPLSKEPLELIDETKASNSSLQQGAYQEAIAS